MKLHLNKPTAHGKHPLMAYATRFHNFKMQCAIFPHLVITGLGGSLTSPMLKFLGSITLCIDSMDNSSSHNLKSGFYWTHILLCITIMEEKNHKLKISMESSDAWKYSSLTGDLRSLWTWSTETSTSSPWNSAVRVCTFFPIEDPWTLLVDILRNPTGLE